MHTTVLTPKDMVNPRVQARTGAWGMTLSIFTTPTVVDSYGMETILRFTPDVADELGITLTRALGFPVDKTTYFFFEHGVRSASKGVLMVPMELAITRTKSGLDMFLDCEGLGSAHWHMTPLVTHQLLAAIAVMGQVQ